MSFTDWLYGSALLSILFGASVAGARGLCRRLLPDVELLPGAVAVAVLTISQLTIVSLALGTIGQFRLLPLVGVSTLVSAAEWWAGHNREVQRGRPTPLDLGRPVEIWIALVAVIAAVARSLASIWANFNVGITDKDSLHYHLTFAAQFAKSGFTGRLPIVSAGDAVPYHPGGIELLHSIGLLAFRVEVLSLVINLVALLLALLAACAIGAREGRGANAVTAAAALLMLPMFGRAPFGSAVNDIPVVALVLCTVALAMRASWTNGGADAVQPPPWPLFALTGLAGGLALGAKLSAAAPVVTCVIACSVVAGGGLRHMARRASVAAAGALAAGGFWFARNLLAVGSPLPALELGPFSTPPMPALRAIDFSVATYVDDSAIVRDVLVPGVRYALGPAAVLLLLLVTASTILLAISRVRLARGFAIAVVLGVVVYLVTPSSAGGLLGQPDLFRPNVRYMAPSLAILVAACVTDLGRRAGVLWAGAFLTVEIVTVLFDSHVRAAGRGVQLAAAGAALVLVAAAAALTRAVRHDPLRATLLGAASITLIVAAGAPLADHYVERRYAHPTTPALELVAFGRTVDGGRTGVTGLPLQYSFFGPHLEGDVSYVAEIQRSHEIRIPTTCRSWRAALDAGGYSRVALIRFRPEEPPAPEAWTKSIRGARLLVANSRGAIYALPSVIDASGC